MWSLAVGFLHVSTSQACQLCTPYPQASAADQILQADAVVLAREDPDRPFHFAAVQVLKGEPGEEPIDLFLDSGTRRTLANRPERSVVLVASQGESGEMIWTRIGLADEDFGPVVPRILESAVAWQSNPDQRIAFFQDWLGHSNDQLRILAHLEIARAPYRRILECKDVMTREQIHRFLADVRYIDWHHLYILLLAAKDHPEDRERIRESFHSNARFNTAVTQEAWAAAYIETAGEEALADIETLYLRRAGRSPEELKAVLQALSVHGTRGHVHLRDRIVEGYALLLEQYPEHAVDLLKDLQAWKREDLTPAIAAIVSDPPESVSSPSLQQLRGHLLAQMRDGLRTARAPVQP